MKSLFCLFAFIVLATTFFIGPCFAEAQPVDGFITLSASQLNADDVLNIMASVRNTSDNEATIKMYIPYYATPEITDAETGKPALQWIPPMDGPVTLRTFVLKPHQELPIMNFRLKVLKDDVKFENADEMGKLLTPVNNGFMSAIPGSYSVKFSLPFDSISGTSNKILVTPAQIFSIVAKEDLGNDQK